MSLSIEKLSAMREELSALAQGKEVHRKHDIVVAEPGALQLTKTSIGILKKLPVYARRFVRGGKRKVPSTTKALKKKPTSAAGKWGRAALIGAGLGVGGTAIGASGILRRHHEMQMGQRIPLHYRPQ